MIIDFQKFLDGVGTWFLFSKNVVGFFIRDGISRKVLVQQMYQVGVRSMVTTCVAGLFVGAILAIQINLQLKDFGAQSFLGGLSTSTTIRNLGPVLIAFLLAGRVGAFSSAELGTMAITDQLNAIRCLGLNPLSVIIMPRLVALTISSFLLLVLGLGLTVFGGIIISSVSLKVNPLQFISHIPQFVSGVSIFIGVLKSFLFGIIIGTISCFVGYQTTGGAEEVGKAVRRTAVVTLVSIIVTDFLVSFVVESISQLLMG
ncbi:MAG: ABC transporter permease [Proteobacteria bacterium]|nr:ABC transporter permease [Pseudomonadota bacterium]